MSSPSPQAAPSSGPTAASSSGPTDASSSGPTDAPSSGPTAASSSGPTDRHGLEVLSLTQCLTLLRSRPLGRLAYLDRGAPAVVPVNHLVDGSTVVLRTLAGGKLDAALVAKPVAFQLDDHDPARGTGWSVVVRGRAEVLDDEDRIAGYEDALDSWAIPGDAEVEWVRIVADEVTGRRLRRMA